MTWVILGTLLGITGLGAVGAWLLWKRAGELNRMAEEEWADETDQEPDWDSDPDP